MDGKIHRGNFEIRKSKPRYSSGNIESNKLFLDNSELKTKNTIVNYNCPLCKKEYSILLKRFLDKETLNCRSCKENMPEKRKKQSDYLIKSFKDFGKISPLIKEKNKISNKDKIIISNNLFDKESPEFKKRYFETHLSNDQFENIKSNIHSVNGIKNTLKFKYYEHIKNNNQMKYSSYLYNEEKDVFINFNNIEYTCENCDEIFKTTRMPIERIRNYKCLCKRCSFSNNTFKIKHTFNILGNKIIYQSNPELELINFCNSNNLPIFNGPKINYYFNGKNRKYLIDYFIPSKKIIIEIKDPHIWHKNQIDSGQWIQKEKAAIEYAKEKGLEYKLIFSQYLKDFLKLFKI